MTRPPPSDPDAPPPTEPPLETGFEEVPPETGAPPRPRRRDPEWVEATDTVTKPIGPGELEDLGEAPSRGPRRPSRALQIAAIAAVTVAVLGAAVLYRAHHRRQVLEKGLARAQQLLFPDTFAGYRDAAHVLEPLVQIDALSAGSVRAFALAMLATDYRDGRAAAAADGLLVEPERATEVPPAANVARAALALGRREAGTAATYAARPGGGAWASVLQARVAMLAGNLSGALEPLQTALAAEAGMPAALALQGDVLRRTKSHAAAKQAYQAALQASPLHPRAAYGMAKLALSGQAKVDEAVPALERLLADRAGTPSNERSRAALHLAALRGRAGDRAGAQKAIEATGLAGAERAWLEKAVAEVELSRSGYRVVDGAPLALQSASDDDPYEPPPPPPPEPPKVAKKVEKKALAKKGAAKPAKKAKAAPKKAGKPKPSAAKKPSAP